MEPPAKKQHTEENGWVFHTLLGGSEGGVVLGAGPPLKFFREMDALGELSNFWKTEKPLTWRGHSYATSEHLYQSLKFVYKDANLATLELAEAIMTMSTPYKAKLLADSRKNPDKYEWQKKLKILAGKYTDRGAKPHPMWEQHRIMAMYAVLQIKFLQDAHCRKVLLNTGDRLLIENSPHDNQWGSGSGGQGCNWLGSLLMMLRHRIRHNIETSFTPKYPAKTAEDQAVRGLHIDWFSVKRPETVCRMVRYDACFRHWEHHYDFHEGYPPEAIERPMSLAVLAAAQVVRTVPIEEAVAGCCSEVHWLLLRIFRFMFGCTPLALLVPVEHCDWLPWTRTEFPMFSRTGGCEEKEGKGALLARGTFCMSPFLGMVTGFMCSEKLVRSGPELKKLEERRLDVF